MNKEYYTFEEIDNLEEKLIDMVGCEELYNAVSIWLGYEKLEKFLRDYCMDWDIQLDEEDDEEVEEDEE